MKDNIITKRRVAVFHEWLKTAPAIVLEWNGLPRSVGHFNAIGADDKGGLCLCRTDGFGRWIGGKFAVSKAQARRWFRSMTDSATRARKPVGFTGDLAEFV